ncbi:MAG: hypothetical protein ACK5QX_01810 [bacterium]
MTGTCTYTAGREFCDYGSDVACDFLYLKQAKCYSQFGDDFSDMDSNCDYYWPNPNDTTNKYECTDATYSPSHSISITGEKFG